MTAPPLAIARANNLSKNAVISVDGRDFTVAGVLKNYNVSVDYMVFDPFRVLQDISDRKGFVSLVNVQNVSLDRDRNLLRDVVPPAPLIFILSPLTHKHH